MYKLKHTQYNIETLKNIAIVLLLCSAIYLFYHSQVLFSSPYGQSGTISNLSNGERPHEVQAEAARPIRMAVIAGIGTAGSVHGIQYNSGAVDTLFQQASTLLQEVLGSLSAPIETSEQQWQLALSSTSGLYFDMLGAVPLSVLSGWLSEDIGASLDTPIRHFILTVGEDDSVHLLYQNADNGKFYTCNSSVVDNTRLLTLIEQYSDNGTEFGFQSNQIQNLSAYTMISGITPVPHIYHAANPLSNTDTLLSLLSFDSPTNSVYTSPNGIVVRNGADTLRIYDNGVVAYQGDISSSRYPISSQYEIPTLFDAVEFCRQLTQNSIGRYSGDARIHLISAEEVDNNLLIRFGYSLNGTLVQFPDDGAASEFLVSDGSISNFTLRFRNYTMSEKTTVLLPEDLAIVAMSSMGYSGNELLLSYYDNYTTQLTADWVANIY